MGSHRPPEHFDDRDVEREGSKKGNDSGSDCGHWVAVATDSSKVEEAWEAA